MQQVEQQRMTGKLGLNQNLPRPGATSCTACDLYDGLGQAFRRPEVSAEESLVRIQNYYEGHVGKVVAFGDHLGTHQDARLTRGHAAHDLLHVTPLAYDIAVQPRDGHPWEEAGQGFFDALGALANRLDRESALWATGG
jgi:hypothetical protein